MNPLRIPLAISAGLLIATGYVLSGEHQQWTVPRTLVGLMFGFMIPWSWLKTPGRSLSRTVLITINVLLSLLILWTAFHDPMEKLIYTFLFCLVFSGIHFALFRLYQAERKWHMEAVKSAVPTATIPQPHE